MQKNLAKRFLILRWSLVVLYLISALLLYFFSPSLPFFTVSFSLITLFNVLFLSRWISRLLFRPILYRDLDIKLLKESLTTKNKVYPTPSMAVMLAFCEGDHQRAVSLCVKMLKKAHAFKDKCFYLSMLAHTYFVLEDTEKLGAVLDAFESLPEKRAKKKHAFMTVYRLYLDGNYESALTVPAAGKKSNLSEVLTLFAYGKICAQMGSGEKACECFHAVKSRAPQLFIAKRSEEWLAHIKEGAPLPEMPPVLPEEVALYGAKDTALIKRWRILRPILFSIGALLLLLGVLPDSAPASCGMRENAEPTFEEKVCAAHEKYYSAYTVIEHFPIYEDGTYYEMLCLSYAEGKLCVFTLVTPDGGETLDLRTLVQSPDAETFYVTPGASGHYIRFRLTEEEVPAEALHSVSLTHEGKEYTFYVDDVMRYEEIFS